MWDASAVGTLFHSSDIVEPLTMAATSGPAPSNGSTNPFVAPAAEIESAWGIGDPEAESIRRQNAPLESFIKAVGTMNYVYAALAGLNALEFVTLFILVARGRVSAPWISEGLIVIYYALCPLMCVLGIVSGYGLRRLRRWAPGATAATTTAWIVGLILLVYRDMSEGRTKDAVSGSLFGVALFLPVIALLCLDFSEIFSPGYRDVLDKTSHIKVRAKLPVPVKIAMALMVLALITVIAWPV